MSDPGPAAVPACYRPHLLQAAGRIGRVRYMAYSLAPVVLCLLVMLCMVCFQMDGAGNLRIALLLLTTGLLAVVASRRLRDIGLPWWLAGLLFVPLAGAPAWLHGLVFAALSLIPGKQLANRHGPPPCSNRRRTVAAASLWIVLFGAAVWLVMSLRHSLRTM